MYSSDLNRRIPKKRAILTQRMFTLSVTLVFLALFFMGLSLTKYTDLIFFSFMVLLVIFSVGFAIYEDAAWKDSWEQLAQQIGVNFAIEPRGFLLKKPVISGTYRGHVIKFDSFERGAGRSRRYYTEIQVYFITPPTSNKLKIRRTTWLNRLGQQFGQDQAKGLVYKETGDPELDRLLMIQAKPAMFADRILALSTIRQGIEETARQAREMTLAVEDNVVRYFERGRTRDIEYLQAVLGLLVEIVTQVEREIQREI